jgi:hypothetical protein
VRMHPDAEIGMLSPAVILTGRVDVLVLAQSGSWTGFQR